MINVVADPELRAALTPDFPPGCKRIPKSPWYYQAVQRPNVRIVRRGVSKVLPEGIQAPDGSVDAYDVIVWATGFDTHAYCRPMEVIGVDGVTLGDLWGDNDVFSYRGVAIPKLPNFFILNGPFSPVNNVTIPRTVNDEMDWITAVLAETVDKSCAFAPNRCRHRGVRELGVRGDPAHGVGRRLRELVPGSQRAPRDLAVVRQGADGHVP